MLNVIKIIIRTIFLLLLPSSLLAMTNCDSQESNCKTTQDKLQLMEKSDIKPTEIVAIPKVQTIDKKQATYEVAPFKIPVPTSPLALPINTIQEPSETGQSNNPTVTPQPAPSPLPQQPLPQTQMQLVPSFNIYIPNPVTTTNTQHQEQEQEFTMQPPKNPLLPSNIQPKNVIQYQ